jgi:hypothetical protein
MNIRTILITALSGLGMVASAATITQWSVILPEAVQLPVFVDWRGGVVYGLQTREYTPQLETKPLPQPVVWRYNLADGKRLNTYTIPGKTPTFAQYDSQFPITLNSAGTRIAVGYVDRTPPNGVQVIEAATGKKLLESATATRANALAFHPTRDELVVGGPRACPVRVYSLKTGAAISGCLLVGDLNDVSQVGFTPKGEVWTEGDNAYPSVFAYPSFKRTARLRFKNISRGGLSFSADGSLVTGCFETFDNDIEALPTTMKPTEGVRGADVYEVATGRVRHVVPGRVYACVRFTGDGRHLISRGVDGVKLWDVRTQRMVRRVLEFGEDCSVPWRERRLEFSQDANNLAPLLGSDGRRALDSYFSCDGAASALRLVKLW